MFTRTGCCWPRSRRDAGTVMSPTVAATAAFWGARACGPQQPLSGSRGQHDAAGVPSRRRRLPLAVSVKLVFRQGSIWGSLVVMLPFEGRLPPVLGILCGAALPWELAGGCSTHHGWSDKPGHDLGGVSRGIHAAWHTTARCAHIRLSASGSSKSHAAASGQVVSLCAISWPRPVASLYATFSFNLLRSSRLRIDHPVVTCWALRCFVNLGD